MAVVSMKQLLEAGVHFGHQTRRWNPKMAPYIYTERNSIYIIDLQKTVKKLEEAYSFVHELSANGESLLFVGTKKQAQDAIKEEAERCGMYYVNARWLGGMLTNFRTMRTRIGVLVNMTVEGIEPAAVTELGKDLCMQVAAMNPAFCDKSNVSQEALDKEKEIQLAQMDNDPKMASKPQQVKEKIVMGKMGKYYEENCLMQMEFVKEKGVSVEQHVASVAKALGGSVKVNSFVRYEKGEGIEKKVDDFAAEVAAAAGLK